MESVMGAADPVLQAMFGCVSLESLVLADRPLRTIRCLTT